MYAIWYLLTKEDSDYIKQIMESLDKKYGGSRFVPHITAYGLMEIDLATITDKTKKIADENKSFHIKSSGLSHSDNIWKTVYINLELNDIMQEISRKLQKSFPRYASYKFEPHISLIYKDLNALQREKIIREIKTKEEFVVDTISIMQFSDSVEDWKIVHTFPLR